MIGSDSLVSAQNGGASADSLRDGHRDPTRHGDTFQVIKWFYACPMDSIPLDAVITFLDDHIRFYGMSTYQCRSSWF